MSAESNEKLMEVMKKHGVKMKAVANATGKTANYVYMVLRGERKNFEIIQTALRLVEERIQAHAALEARVQELAEQES